MEPRPTQSAFSADKPNTRIRSASDGVYPVGSNVPKVGEECEARHQEWIGIGYPLLVFLVLNTHRNFDHRQECFKRPAIATNNAAIQIGDSTRFNGNYQRVF